MGDRGFARTFLCFRPISCAKRRFPAVATFLCHLPGKMPDLILARTETPPNFRNSGNEGLTMKLVVAIIKPFKLDEVRQALTASASMA